ncbi:dephospho-CoA kinase [Flavobacterium sp.]|uniref:dephospho-CoA kinase n=1 Tax=Flavobacterium sp. TaxID=239 RepID=UPI00286DD159|nr:dephospho-CoA kinase [Flavobacterium sp.]
MTKIIGLTGGIGSGKTTIARLFESSNIPVYIADDEAKKIMQLPETISLIVEEFGKNIIINNKIDPKLLSKIVFNSPEKLKILNSIIHPLVKKHFDMWVQEHQKAAFVIKEAAILFESGSYKYCDVVITVIADEETRITRVMKRDNCSREHILDRIKNQWTDAQKAEKSDYIIVNDDFEIAKSQVKAILKKIKNLH